MGTVVCSSAFEDRRDCEDVWGGPLLNSRSVVRFSCAERLYLEYVRNGQFGGGRAATFAEFYGGCSISDDRLVELLGDSLGVGPGGFREVVGGSLEIECDADGGLESGEVGLAGFEVFASGVDDCVVGTVPVVGVVSGQVSGGPSCLGGDMQVDAKKLARREKNKRRRSNRRERKNSEPNGCPVPEWRRGASVQSPVFPACGSSEVKKGLPSGQSPVFPVGVKRGFFSDLSEEQRVELQASRAALLVKQNKLAAQRADRELEVLMATDIEAEKRRQSTKLRAAIERNMVSIEKTHATLIATDNVKRDELDHDVHTVVTDGVPSLSSGSISPNSSASMAEYRAMQKQLLDEQKKLSDVEARNEKLSAALKKLGIEESIVGYLDKDLWTINSEGTLDDDAKAALDVLAPEGYVIPGQAYMSKGDKAVIRAL